MVWTVYKIQDGDFKYYGSTSLPLKKREHNHNSNLKSRNNKLYKYFRNNGIERIKLEEISKYDNREDALKAENELIRSLASDICLNERCSYLTPEEKKEKKKDNYEKFLMKNPEYRNQKNKEFRQKNPNYMKEYKEKKKIEATKELLKAKTDFLNEVAEMVDMKQELKKALNDLDNQLKEITPKLVSLIHDDKLPSSDEDGDDYEE